MESEYSEACVNFRDVGEFVNLISNQYSLPKNTILRGGKTDFVKSANEINNPKIIINLRKVNDSHTFGADYFHIPIDNGIEKYHTEQKEVRKWLNTVLGIFEDNELKYPVFIHCLSGKDRTGVAVAAILLVLGVEKQVIIDEYLLSDGEIKENLIKKSIDGIGEVTKYFNRVNLEKVRINILKTDKV